MVLETYGHTVKLSRSTDVFLTLSERAEMANNWGADYFVSLYNNAAISNASGFETFIHNGPVSSKTVGLQNAIHNSIVNDIGILNYVGGVKTTTPREKEDDELEFSSPSLKAEMELTLGSKARREIIINAAIAAKYTVAVNK